MGVLHRTISFGRQRKKEQLIFDKKDMNDLIETLIRQCESFGAATVSLKLERSDNYAVELKVRIKDKVAYDEFSQADLANIRALAAQWVLDNPLSPMVSSYLGIINVCQSRLGEAEITDMEALKEKFESK